MESPLLGVSAGQTHPAGHTAHRAGPQALQGPVVQLQEGHYRAGRPLAPLRSHASLHNPDSWEDDPAGREDPPSHGSSAWRHRGPSIPSRAAPGSGTRRTNCSPPPRKSTSPHLSLRFYGLEESLFDKCKKIFPNGLKTLRRASHPQACGCKALFLPVRAAGEPCWCPERLAAGGDPGGSRSLVTGLEGRLGPPSLSPREAPSTAGVPWRCWPTPSQGLATQSPNSVANLPLRKLKSTTRLAKQGHALCCCNSTESTGQSRLIKTSCSR